MMEKSIIEQANKEIFELAQSAYDRDAGVDHYNLLVNDDQFFMDNVEQDDLIVSYTVHTRKFVARISSEIVLSDMSLDSGTWERRYLIENYTNHYRKTNEIIKTSELIKLLSE